MYIFKYDLIACASLHHITNKPQERDVAELDPYYDQDWAEVRRPSSHQGH